jgi:hypothetical protein
MSRIAARRAGRWHDSPELASFVKRWRRGRLSALASSAKGIIAYHTGKRDTDNCDRVETLISIRFIAQRPSQSSACAAVQVGSSTSPPT